MRLVLIVEDRAHALAARALADRVLIECGLEQLCRDLSLDPVREPDRLRGDRRRTGKDSQRDIKATLARLTGDDPAREERCLTATPLRLLAERGTTSGLGNFLFDLHAHLLPCFDPSPATDCAALGKVRQ